MDNIFDWSYDELKEWFKGKGEGAFRAKQVLDYLYKGAESFEDMKNLNGSSKEKLKEAFVIHIPQVIDKRVSKDGTVKMLLALQDGNIIETVVMKYVYGYSVCVSSQVGCAMGCSFCASTKGGMVRNLLAGEILGQVLAASKEAGERMSHVVLMGSGEPLDNFENVLKFLELVNMKEGLGLSHRNITLSTCGLVDRIRELADLKLQITLAISLHAVTDDKRREIMPIARRWSIAEILDSVRYYMDTTGRRVSFEYSLVNGVNDSLEDAYALAALLRGMKTHVNLIPVNVIKEMLFRPSQNKAVESFRNALDSRGIEATVRREMGSDIDAACGQLRRSYLDGM
ncbi:MAG: 23S rRNA (adenine(2503)-C(2))-methyltransferase RlmN [Youngiibacter sp.]|nr:23S rRNA (adenine(2503)-C(2))-methyltransferase RlmN [Youngiibacter sp.]